MKYTITQSRLLYVMSIDDRKHRGLLKVGEVFVDNDVADCGDMSVLMDAVREQLQGRSYLDGVEYKLEYVESTTYDNKTRCYKVKNLHDVLINSGVEAKYLVRGTADIWFKTDLTTVKRAIKAVTEGKKTFNGTDSQVKPSAIVFRPEQRSAIEDTVKHFSTKTGRRFLWNAKMRFGKTLSGLEVAKRMGYNTTLILTHRPVVDQSWHEDFDKIFGNLPEYVYATRMQDGASEGDFYELIKKVENKKKKLIFFVSIQYLRLSTLVGGKDREQLKRDIMNYDWDLVMIDEAHEGTESMMGSRVIQKLTKENTRILSLSGTPFNLLDKYEDGEIYTWDYVMEQTAKRKWDDKHYGDPNPYADLPRMQILTFTMSDMLHERIGDGNMFKFHEFFRVWTGDLKEDSKYFPNGEKPADYRPGHFIHERKVNLFLDKLVETSATSQYPFSTKEFRDNFRHSFWLLPYVREAAAMEALLKEHKVFKNFKIVNVAGDGNIEDENGNALREVQEAIKNNRYTITLSCGKLTTGVSVPEWTAVLMMKGSENTPASSYMQTIFRVQTHAVLKGRQKSDAYVFDFAPDRALTAVTEAAKMSVIAGEGKSSKNLKQTQKKEEMHLQAFLELCPVISMDGATMGRQITANQLFERLKDVYIERAVRSGYADNSLYNPDALMNLTPAQEKALGDVHELLGSMPNIWKPSKIEVNRQGFDVTKDADGVQYIYHLSDEAKAPAKPSPSDYVYESGAPKPKEDGWTDAMPQVDAVHKYCYVSYAVLKDGVWSDYYVPQLWKHYSEPKNKTEEQEQRERENREKRARMSVLRGVSIRIPLLVYGADIDEAAGEEITIDNFTDIVDDASWEEYMPTGFTKATFNLLKECFDRSIFTGAANRIRQMVKSADDLSIEERIDKIAQIFACFHNPDKETVLTPWRVVNMHMSDCLGGWCFFNDQFDGPYTEPNEFNEQVKSVRFVDKGDVTKDIFGDYNTRILEINSKTGLYPLYMAYSVFRTVKEGAFRGHDLTGERGQKTDNDAYTKQVSDDEEIWKEVLQDNIFVVCRTPMAVSITKRTLAGFKNFRMNVVCYKQDVSVNDLIKAGILRKDDEKITKVDKTYYLSGKSIVKCDMTDVLRANPERFISDVVAGSNFWHVYSAFPLKKNEEINNMKFNAIIGNPPYSIMDGGNGGSSKPIYHKFVDSARTISPMYISMIMPSRWFSGGKGLNDFRKSMIEDESLCILHDYMDSKDCFPNVFIEGGVCYFMWDKENEEPCHIFNHNKQGVQESTRYLNEGELDIFIRDDMAKSIVSTVTSHKDFKSFGATYVQSRNYFKMPELKEDDFSFGNADGQLKVLGRFDNERNVRTLRADYKLKKDFPLTNQWKIFMSKADGAAGQIGNPIPARIIGKPEIGEPMQVCTETFLVMGPFKREEITYVENYIRSKFFRFMVGTRKNKNMTKDTYNFVPVVDFTRVYTDTELYNLFGLNDEQRSYIEKMIE